MYYRLLALCCTGVASVSTESRSQTPALGDSPDLQDGGDKKKRKRPKKKKDPNEPRKPKSAYILLCAEFRRNLDPPVSFNKMTALVCSSLQPCRCAVMRCTCQTALAIEPRLLNETCHHHVRREQISCGQDCACEGALTIFCSCGICWW